MSALQRTAYAQSQTTIEAAVTSQEQLRKLLDDPRNHDARRAIGKTAASMVANEFWKLEVGERPNLQTIARSILSEHTTGFSKTELERLGPVVLTVVEGVLDDDEPSRVTELFREWQASGREEGDELFGAIQVAIAKRLGWVLGKFGNLNQRVSPGELLGDLYLRLRQSGLPDSLQNRKEFYWYAETVLKHLLLDRIRSEGAQKRAINVELPLEDLIYALEECKEGGCSVGLSREELLDLIKAIEELPKDLGDVIRYRYLWGWPQKDLERLWNMSRATLDRRQREALVSLKLQLSAGGYSASARN